MYDGRVKSDFILFVGLVNSLRSFPNLPYLQNKILLITLIGSAISIETPPVGFFLKFSNV
jgi:hypothetical protein